VPIGSDLRPVQRPLVLWSRENAPTDTASCGDGIRGTRCFPPSSFFPAQRIVWSTNQIKSQQPQSLPCLFTAVAAFPLAAVDVIWPAQSFTDHIPRLYFPLSSDELSPPNPFSYDTSKEHFAQRSNQFGPNIRKQTTSSKYPLSLIQFFLLWRIRLFNVALVQVCRVWETDIVPSTREHPFIKWKSLFHLTEMLAEQSTKWVASRQTGDNVNIFYLKNRNSAETQCIALIFTQRIA
jgi:hypothetical protein